MARKGKYRDVAPVLLKDVGRLYFDSLPKKRRTA